MSLISVVQDVCAVVGVARPSSIFAGLNSSRTQQELLALANEMAQRIAYNTREWTELFATASMTGDGSTEAFPLPATYQRMLLTSEVFRSTFPAFPMRFIPDINEWARRRAYGYSDYRGEWMLADGKIFIRPLMDGVIAAWRNSFPYLVGAKAFQPGLQTYWQAVVAHTSAASGTFEDDRIAHPTYWTNINLLPWKTNFHYTVGMKVYDPTDNSDWRAAVDHISGVGTFAADRFANPTYWTVVSPSSIVTATFFYLANNCIALNSGGFGPEFISDGDSFRLNERLLKLGMIWQWKANKGSPYAEDMGNYSDALAVASGANKPAPIIIGRLPISSAANVAIPWPPGWGP